MLNTYRKQFSNIDEMDQEMITNWNSLIGKNDQVYHLGDVALCEKKRAGEIIWALNGQIFLIRGNHENAIEDRPENRKRFQWIKDIEYLKVNGEKLMLCHYAMRTWRSSHHGSWHLYGHSHGSLPENPNARAFDVGVDAWNLFPISFETVAKKMASKGFEAVDHHGR